MAIVLKIRRITIVNNGKNKIIHIRVCKKVHHHTQFNYLQVVLNGRKRVAESAVVAGYVNSYLPTYLPMGTFYHAQKGNYSTHTKKKTVRN